ncbi:MAG TPA: ABC transporter ATP-binding protein, partial [Aequorivita sp.]|nr:ABC transporter ATP-binding protein [Aequorivita sp.]
MISEKKNIILNVRDLSIGYSNKKSTNKIARKINLSLSKGELIGLVGANGIGKSTLLRTLSGMQTALGGSVFLYDKPIESYSSFQLARQLSIVLTEPPATKNLS